MNRLIATLTTLNAYLVHPDNMDALGVEMEKYNSDREAFNRDFFRITLDRLSGCCAKVISENPNEVSRKEVTDKKTILFIAKEYGFEIGYCSNNGEYTQEIINDDALIERLKEYSAGDDIQDTADLLEINAYLTSKGISTQLRPDSVTAILKTMGIPKNRHGRYINQKISVYQFLTELNTTRSDTRLTSVIALIDEHNKTRWKAIAAWIALLSTGSVVPFWLYGFTAIEQFVTAASVVAAGGLAYSVAIALYTLYEYSPAEGIENTWYQLFKDNFFALSNSALVVAGWALILTAAASNPVISVLFVAGEFVLALKEVVALTYIAYQDKPTIASTDPLDEQQRKVRESADFEKRKNDVYVNLAAAILMTVIIAAWCFIPGGFIVPVVCMIGIGLVKATTQWAIWQNEARIKEQVQTQFTTIEEAKVSTNLAEPSVTNEPWLENNLGRKRTMSLTEKASAYPNPSLGNRARANSDPNPYPATVSTIGLFKPARQSPESIDKAPTSAPPK